MEQFGYFYLDKEKDIIVTLFKNGDELSYVLETPNHKSGNLITNLAKVCSLNISFNEKGLKIIKGVIPCYIVSSNNEVYVLRLGNTKIANIYNDGHIEIKATIPAISKTLMSQTKDCKLSEKEVLVKTYILKQCKFKTDLHTHMNANLLPDVLIALGIIHQIRYPLYYIKKLGLSITDEQAKALAKQREIVAKGFVHSELTGKYLDRRIDDNTFINFADLILNNIVNADFNIKRIRASLSLLKDGQAVFTNLEKVYLYRYVFTKGKTSDKTINLKNINRIPDKDIISYLKQMRTDKNNPIYAHNTLFQDKLLWIARSYGSQGIQYVEISDTTLVKLDAVNELQQIHEICPKILQETGVSIRFLAAMRRIPLTIIKDQKTPANYLRDNLDIIKAVALDPYVVGSDFVGEEINDIRELKPVISELVGIAKNDPYFTIRIHAGENDSLTGNVANSIECVKNSLQKGQAFPKMRLGHGLYTADLNTKKGKALINTIKETGVVLEFQITSNVRLNNLNGLDKHPLKKYLANDIACVQGSDGFGLYGVDSFDEQLALDNLLQLSVDDLLKIRKTENMILNDAEKSFNVKCEQFSQFLNGRDLKTALLKQIEENQKTGYTLSLSLTSKLESEKELATKIEPLPEGKTPIIIAGGSFNSDHRLTHMIDYEKEMIDHLLNELNPEEYFFVIGNQVSGYEKYLVNKNKNRFSIFAIVPALISEKERDTLIKQKLSIRVSTESLGMGIYKSFNYEIFERRNSILIALDGNSAGANLIQEAKNGKGHCYTYVSENCVPLKNKAQSLEGYTTIIDKDTDLVTKIKERKIK